MKLLRVDMKTKKIGAMDLPQAWMTVLKILALSPRSEALGSA